MKRRILLGLALVLALLVARILVNGGAFYEVRPHGPECARIEGVVGAEDLTIRQDKGWAYVSSFDRRAAFRGGPVQGQIFRLSVATSTLTLLQHDLRESFQPHGLSLFVDEAGRETLAVVNHGDGHSIELFSVQGPRLVHQRTVQGDLLVHPNDVHATGHETFFFTNDHGFGSKPMQVIEDFGQFGWGNVIAFDGKTLSVAYEGTAYANGIQGSPDGTQLYVSESVGQRLHIFDRSDTQLTLQRSLDLDTGLDNIEIDEHGRLWIGAHPKLLAFVQHAKSAEVRSPSQVLRVTLAGAQPVVDEVYLNDGALMSGGAVAAVWKDRMILGPVFEGHMLSCTRPD